MPYARQTRRRRAPRKTTRVRERSRHSMVAGDTRTVVSGSGLVRTLPALFLTGGGLLGIPGVKTLLVEGAQSQSIGLTLLLSAVVILQLAAQLRLFQTTVSGVGNAAHESGEAYDQVTAVLQPILSVLRMATRAPGAAQAD